MMLKFIKSLSLKNLLLFWGISSFLLILLSSFAYYKIGTSQISDTIQHNAQKMLSQTGTSLEDALSAVQKSGQQLTNSYILQRLSSKLKSDSEPLGSSQYYSLAQTMDAFFVQNPHSIHSISFYFDDASILFFRHQSGNPFRRINTELLQSADYSSPNQLSWVNPQTSNFLDFSSLPTHLGLFQSWGDTDTKVRAFLQIEISNQLLLDTIANTRITPNSFVSIVQDGVLLFENEPSLTSEKSFHLTPEESLELQTLLSTPHAFDHPRQIGENYILYHPTEIADLGIIAILPIQELFLGSSQFQKMFLTIFILLFTLWLTIYLLISWLVSKPVLLLENKLATMNVDNLNTSVVVDGSNEISSISQTIQNLLVRIHSLIQALNIEMDLKRKAELSALHAQINPHFLYNTLDSVYQLCDLQETEKAKEMTKNLASFYRVGVSKGMTAIPLHQELLHIHSYLSILKNRFEDFTYDIAIPKEYHNISIMRITLQPLIENAIYHGIRPTRKTGHVQVSATQLKDCLHIYIEDNGIGIPEDRLAILNQTLTQPISEKTQSPIAYGIRNVNDRLRLTYGGIYGISISSCMDCGTQIEVRIPFHSYLQKGGNHFV